MNILVGDLAKLYGISSQTLHYYEERDILHPKRDMINGYRYYETTDLSRLGTVKKYRNAEFPLHEAMSIYENCTEWEIVSLYNKQKNLLWEEIEKKQYIISQLDKDLSMYMRYKEIGSTIIVEKLEGFLRFESAGSQIIFQDNETRTEAIPWFKNILHTCASQMFYIDDNTKKFSHSTFGMLATISTARFLNLGITENVKEIEGGNFITSIINTNYDELFEKSIYNCLDYINNNNLKIRGMPFTKTIFVYKDDNNLPKLLEQILIPVY